MGFVGGKSQRRDRSGIVGGGSIIAQIYPSDTSAEVLNNGLMRGDKCGDAGLADPAGTFDG